MYSIVFTKGDTETVIAEFDDLEKAKAEEKRLEKLPEYCDGLITVEKKTEKGSRIY